MVWAEKPMHHRRLVGEFSRLMSSLPYLGRHVKDVYLAKERRPTISDSSLVLPNLQTVLGKIFQEPGGLAFG
jgi:hypothetical protein